MSWSLWQEWVFPSWIVAIASCYSSSQTRLPLSGLVLCCSVCPAMEPYNGCKLTMLWCNRWESCRLPHRLVRSWALKLKEWKGFIGRLFFDGGKLTQDKSNTNEMQQLLFCTLNVWCFVKILNWIWVLNRLYEYQFSFKLKVELITLKILHFDLPFKTRLRGTRKWFSYS